jgi:hypothetical protein
MTDHRTTISVWETTRVLLDTQKPTKLPWDAFLLALGMAWDEISTKRKLDILNQAGSGEEEKDG